jgi:selenocysteine-specific translation elongation factor
MTGVDASRPLTLGTAGRIDHGKTAVIARLTGVDTDRLPEEPVQRARAGQRVALNLSGVDRRAVARGDLWQLRTSLKFAQALLEHLDAARVTRRRPDDSRIPRRHAR